MSQLTISQTDYYYHVYNRGVERRTLFLDRQDYGLFKSRIYKYSVASKVSVFAYCVMPNHYHLLVQSNDETDLTKMIHRLQTSYAGYFNKRYKHSGYVFQGRYNCKKISTTTYLMWLTCYIHLNPVDSGLVTKPDLWPHSNYVDYLKDTNPLTANQLIEFSYKDIMEEYLNKRKEKEKYTFLNI
ncbi:MAG TPA: transposase [Acidobacteriota bacterium]|nr:transposase [Acidobacteriota bacterium]